MDTPPPDIARDVEVAIAAARAGAAAVAAGARPAAADVAWKGAVNPVTVIDHAAETAALEVVRDVFPHDEILAEESGAQPGTSGRRWIVDPLDGTVNFLHGVPHSACSVALLDGVQAMLGVTVNPFRNEEFVAWRRGGAWCNGARIAVSSTAGLGEALLATGFPYDRNEHGRSYGAAMGAVLEACQGIRRFGSAVLDLADLACGRYDGFWEHLLAPWDTAAGIVLVEEAGGRVSDPHGVSFRPGDRTIVASNGRIHDALAAVVAANPPAHFAGALA